jgi:hypothetical protein
LVSEFGAGGAGGVQGRCVDASRALECGRRELRQGRSLLPAASSLREGLDWSNVRHYYAGTSGGSPGPPGLWSGSNSHHLREASGISVKEIYEKREFASFHDRDSAHVYGNCEFRNCSFVSCTLSMTNDPRLRTRVEDARLRGCDVRGCAIYPAVISEVVIDGLVTHNILQTWGAVFSHVTLKGKVGRIMITNGLGPSFTLTDAHRRAFESANQAFYESTDWALDISQGEFEELDIRGVPARLIRRDPQTQAVVTRERAMQGRWRDLDSKGNWTIGIELMLQRGDQDVVLVAGKRSKKFKDRLAGLELLREAGVAEPA